MAKKKKSKATAGKKKKIVVRKRKTTIRKRVGRSRKTKVIRRKKGINFLKPFWIGIIFLLLSGFLKTQLSNPLPLSPSQIVNEFDQQIDFTKLPAEIEIPRIEVNLAVEQTLIEEGKWGMNPKTASHLLTSAVPGRNGNIIIYGHNKKGQFKDLGKVGFGDVIKLKTNDGRVHPYKIATKNIVWPNEIKFLLPTQSETLTLYTCIGFADSKRLVIRAEPALKSLTQN